MSQSQWKHIGISDFWAREPGEQGKGYYSAAISVTVGDSTSDEKLSASGLVLSDLPEKCGDFNSVVVSAVKLTESRTSSDLLRSAAELSL